ncbi:uncharacterized protein LOC144138293 isoform X2 [Haemaphysalis longicornis]
MPSFSNMDSAPSKWKPVFSRLMNLLKDFQAEVDADRRSVDTMNEIYRQFISLSDTLDKNDENKASTGQVDPVEARQKLESELEKADSILNRARQLRNGEPPQNTKHPATKSRRSRSVVMTKQLSTVGRERPRSTSQSRGQKPPLQRRSSSPSKKAEKVSYREMLSSPDVQAQLREFSALVDEARKCAASSAECPERRQFLALYGSEANTSDGESSTPKLPSVLTSPTFPTRHELGADYKAYIDRKCAALHKCIVEFCTKSVVPLLEDTPSTDPEYAAVMQIFYGIICNKGLHFPAFVDCEQ